MNLRAPDLNNFNSKENLESKLKSMQRKKQRLENNKLKSRKDFGLKLNKKLDKPELLKKKKKQKLKLKPRRLRKKGR